MAAFADALARRATRAGPGALLARPDHSGRPAAGPGPVRRRLRGGLRQRGARGRPARPASGPGMSQAAEDALSPVGADPAVGDLGAALPWRTLPRTFAAPDDAADDRLLPELLPSAVAADRRHPPRRARRRPSWSCSAGGSRSPHRAGRRAEADATRPGPRRTRVALRETIAASRRTGWETMELQRYSAVHRPLTVTLFCDVSQSMQSLRDGVPSPDAGLREDPAGGDVRVLDLADQADSRLVTPLGRGRGGDGGGSGHRPIRRHPPGRRACTSCSTSRHGNAVRGGVLVIACDGWDSDAPAALAAVMARPGGARAGSSGSTRALPPQATNRWSGRWPRRCRTATPSCRPTTCVRSRPSSTRSPARAVASSTA